MNRDKVKALLESGVLQAYAEGKPIWMEVEKQWLESFPLTTLSFDSPAEAYAVSPPKPKFKVDDWVKIDNCVIGRIRELTKENRCLVQGLHGGMWNINDSSRLTLLNHKLIPHTFETACRAISQHGRSLYETKVDIWKIQGLYRNNVNLRCGTVCQNLNFDRNEVMKLTHPDGTPFAQVVFEEVQ